MKTCLRLVWASIVLLTFAQVANSQGLPASGGFGGPAGGVYNADGFQPLRGDLNLGLPGRVWIGGTYADQGLGYQSSYLTIGGKRRLFEDAFDGRWLSEGRFHYALEDGGFFGNFGVERVISIAPAGADVTLSGWIDYDGDEQGSFGHSFAAVGISAGIKTRRWDLTANGYFPVGTTDFTTSTANDHFLGNNLVVTHGTDSALRGFDATLRLRPQMLGMVNGTVDLGGYGYGSDLIPYFGGGRVRMGMQTLGGMVVNAEVTQDNRFDTTFALNLGWIYGANGGNSAYGGLGRDLEQTIRNDHIVRFQEDLVLAINPDTGAAYNVIHVDNTADPTIETGAVETPFQRLATAEAASMVNDIIFVNEGNGTTSLYDQGIVLQDGQRLLGSGVTHIIPIQNGLNLVCTTAGGRPTITNNGGGNGITLANNNVVSGIIVDGTAGVMANGIFGDGVILGNPLTNGTITNTTVTGAILNGVALNDIDGNWTFENNNFNNNGVDGVLIEDACDPTSQFVFNNNTFNGNGRDGLHFDNYDAESLVLSGNQSNNNGRDGVRLENFKNGSGNGLTLDLLGHVATGNSGFGINIENGDGNLRVVNGNVTGNGGGLRIANWTNTDPLSTTFVGTLGAGGVSNYSNNITGTGIDVELGAGNQRLLISNTTANGNANGVRLLADGVGTLLEANIFDNISFSNNTGDGIRLVSTNGATLRTIIDQPTVGGQLQVNGNGQAGINILAGSASAGTTSVIDAMVTNTLLSQNGVGLRAASGEDGQILLTSTNMNWSLNQVHVDILTQGNTTNAVNSFRFDGINMDNTSGLIGGAGDAFRVRNLGDSLLDLIVTNSVITNTNSDFNPPGGGGTLLVDNQAGFGEGQGFDIQLSGANSLTRFVLTGTTVSNFNFGGALITTTDQARLLMNLSGNNMAFNGFGGGDNLVPNGTVNLVPATATPSFQLVSTGTSVVNYVAQNNSFNSNYGSLGAGNFVQTAAGNATINAVWNQNSFVNTLNPLGANHFTVNNVGANATTCLSMSDNVFANNSVAITNTGGVGDLTLEFDGFSNGVSFDNTNPQIVGPRTEAVFGSTCLPAVSAEDTAFGAAGFPILP